jgi:hypothetical protein
MSYFFSYKNRGNVLPSFVYLGVLAKNSFHYYYLCYPLEIKKSLTSIYLLKNDIVF